MHDLIALIDLREEAPQALGRNIKRDVLDIATGAGFREGGLVDVGGKDLDRCISHLVANILEQTNGDGIALFPASTSRHPDSDRLVCRSVAEDGGKDFALECLKGLRIAEKPGHFDK